MVGPGDVRFVSPCLEFGIPAGRHTNALSHDCYSFFSRLSLFSTPSRVTFNPDLEFNVMLEVLSEVCPRQSHTNCIYEETPPFFPTNVPNSSTSHGSRPKFLHEWQSRILCIAGSRTILWMKVSRARIQIPNVDVLVIVRACGIGRVPIHQLWHLNF